MNILYYKRQHYVIKLLLLIILFSWKPQKSFFHVSEYDFYFSATRSKKKHNENTVSNLIYFLWILFKIGLENRLNFEKLLIHGLL